MGGVIKRQRKQRVKRKENERKTLQQRVRRQTEKQAIVVRAKIIVLADKGVQHQEMAQKLSIRNNTVTQWTKRWIDRADLPAKDRLQDPSRPEFINTELRLSWAGGSYYRATRGEETTCGSKYTYCYCRLSIGIHQRERATCGRLIHTTDNRDRIARENHTFSWLNRQVSGMLHSKAAKPLNRGNLEYLTMS